MILFGEASEPNDCISSQEGPWEVRCQKRIDSEAKQLHFQIRLKDKGK